MLNVHSRPTPQNVRNRLLRLLPPADLERLCPRLELVELPLKSILLTPNTAVKHVHFVETGTVSIIATLVDGTQTEVGLVGPEGLVGMSLVLGAPTSALEGLTQVAGTALRLPAAVFHTVLAEMPAFLGLLLRYVDAFHVQVSQTAACNGRHQIEQRLARWLLMTHDRVEGDCFPMTQEFMATMLGVQRPGVTLAMSALQRAGLVQHDKGNMQVLDRPGLEAASCGCYHIVQQRFDWLWAQHRPAPRPFAAGRRPIIM